MFRVIVAPPKARASAHPCANSSSISLATRERLLTYNVVLPVAIRELTALLVLFVLVVHVPIVRD